MSQTKVEKIMKNKFNTFTKLSVGFGVSFVLVVGMWCTLLALELFEIVMLRNHEYLVYVYYAIFFLTSILVPTWIAMSAVSAINSVSVIQIDTRKYKIKLLVAGIVSILGIAIGAIIIVMGLVQRSATDEPNWTLISVGSCFMLLALAAIVFGVVCNIISLAQSKKK